MLLLTIWMYSLLVLHTSSFIIGNKSTNFSEARIFCQLSYGTDLATITTSAEHNETKAICGTVDQFGIHSVSRGCWIGLFQDLITLTWNWTDGTTLGYGFNADGSPNDESKDPWWPGEPNQHTGKEDCVHLYDVQQYNWNDIPCSYRNYPICNHPSSTSPTTDPTSAPTSNPTAAPIIKPSMTPTKSPTIEPSTSPTDKPTTTPTNSPTVEPSKAPSSNPSFTPTTREPSANPTGFPSMTPTVSPTTNEPSTSPTSRPTFNPTVPTTEPTNDPTIEPTTGSPSISPSTVSPTMGLNAVSPTTYSIYNATYLECDSCVDPQSRISIKVSYFLSKRVRYNLQNMECFLYQIFYDQFMEFAWSKSFNKCDIEILTINGGSIDESDRFCEFKPCLESFTTLTRRLLQNDGNSSMVITTSNSSIYADLNILNLSSMADDFEEAFINDFDVELDIVISVEEGNDDVINSTDSGSFWDKENPLLYIIFAVIFLFACNACIISWFCCGLRSVNRQMSKSSMDDLNKFDQSKRNKTALRARIASASVISEGDQIEMRRKSTGLTSTNIITYVPDSYEHQKMLSSSIRRDKPAMVHVNHRPNVHGSRPSSSSESDSDKGQTSSSSDGESSTDPSTTSTEEDAPETKEDRDSLDKQRARDLVSVKHKVSIVASMDVDDIVLTNVPSNKSNEVNGKLTTTKGGEKSSNNYQKSIMPEIVNGKSEQTLISLSDKDGDHVTKDLFDKLDDEKFDIDDIAIEYQHGDITSGASINSDTTVNIKINTNSLSPSINNDPNSRKVHQPQMMNNANNNNGHEINVKNKKSLVSLASGAKNPGVAANNNINMNANANSMSPPINNNPNSIMSNQSFQQQHQFIMQQLLQQQMMKNANNNGPLYGQQQMMNQVGSWGNYQTYNRALNMYQQNVRNYTNFKHAPHGAVAQGIEYNVISGDIPPPPPMNHTGTYPNPDPNQNDPQQQQMQSLSANQTGLAGTSSSHNYSLRGDGNQDEDTTESSSDSDTDSSSEESKSSDDSEQSSTDDGDEEPTYNTMTKSNTKSKNKRNRSVISTISSLSKFNTMSTYSTTVNTMSTNNNANTLSKWNSDTLLTVERAHKPRKKQGHKYNVRQGSTIDFTQNTLSALSDTDGLINDDTLDEMEHTSSDDEEED